MYVARDKDECLWLFIDKPIRSQTNGRWEVDTQNSLLRDDDCLQIDECIIPDFPEISWEDEPIEVDLVRKEKKNGYDKR